MYCEKCGKEITENSIFCSLCGNKVGSPTVVPEPLSSNPKKPEFTSPHSVFTPPSVGSIPPESSKGNVFRRTFTIFFKVALPLFATLLLTVLLITALNYSNTKKSIDQTIDNIVDSNLDILLSQVSYAKEIEQVVSSEMDKKNLALVHAFAEIVRLNAVSDMIEPQNMPYYQKIADLLNAEEVSIVDSNGILIGGNNEGYYGFDFNSSDQTIPFMYIIDDSSYELVQEPQPSSNYEFLLQYIGIARTDEQGIVQVGIDASIIQKLHELTGITNIIGYMRIGLTGYTSVLQDGIIVYSGATNMIGRNVNNQDWYKQVSEKQGKIWTEIDGKRMYTGYTNVDDMTITVMFPEDEYNGYLAPVIKVGFIGAAVAVLISLLAYVLVSFISLRYGMF